MKQIKFSFEDLQVWQRAVEFAKMVLDITGTMNIGRKHYRIIEQLESASTSIALNIAEGQGRYSKREFLRFLYIARGSLYETLTLLIIFNRNNWLADKQLLEMKNFAHEIGKMLSGLINAIKQSIAVSS
jgi:four helix bundle protein